MKIVKLALAALFIATPARASWVSLAIDDVRTNTVSEIGDKAQPGIFQSLKGNQDTYGGALFPIAVYRNILEPGVGWAGKLDSQGHIGANRVLPCLNFRLSQYTTQLLNAIGSLPFLSGHLGLLKDVQSYAAIGVFVVPQGLSRIDDYGVNAGIRISAGGGASSSSGGGR